MKVYSQKLGGTLSYYHDRYGLEADAVLHLENGRYALIEFKLGFNGRGKFLFMMFLPDEDKEAKDKLYIFMRNTRDKTLRKMYLYLDADYDKISKLIDDLKTKNMTVAWTTEDKRDMAADINEFID